MLFPGMLVIVVNNLTKARIKIAALTLAALALIACASNVTIPKADSKLMGTKAGGFDHVLMLPGSGIAPFKKVYIEDPKVTFNKHWLLDFRGDYTDKDLERITSTYGKMLKKALTKGLTEQTQTTVVNSAAETDIIFRPLLRELNIYGPDLSMPGRTKKYVYEVGNATFDLTLIQASNNKVMAQFIDHRETSASIGDRMEQTNRVTNARYFRMLMERWSRNLTDYLSDTGSVSAK